jgi:hypothetical protein
LRWEGFLLLIKEALFLFAQGKRSEKLKAFKIMKKEKRRSDDF